MFCQGAAAGDLWQNTVAIPQKRKLMRLHLRKATTSLLCCIMALIVRSMPTWQQGKLLSPNNRTLEISKRIYGMARLTKKRPFSVVSAMDDPSTADIVFANVPAAQHDMVEVKHPLMKKLQSVLREDIQNALPEYLPLWTHSKSITCWTPLSPNRQGVHASTRRDR